MKKNDIYERGERGEREGFDAAAYGAAHGGPWRFRNAAGSPETTPVAGGSSRRGRPDSPLAGLPSHSCLP